MAGDSEDEFVPDATRSPTGGAPRKMARRAPVRGISQKPIKRRNCKYGERTLTRKAMAEMAAYGPSKPYDIPYFAHQSLDPDVFPICKYLCIQLRGLSYSRANANLPISRWYGYRGSASAT